MHPYGRDARKMGGELPSRFSPEPGRELASLSGWGGNACGGGSGWGECCRAVKRRLKGIQYRTHLVDGCIAATGLSLDG